MSSAKPRAGGAQPVAHDCDEDRKYPHGGYIVGTDCENIKREATVTNRDPIGSPYLWSFLVTASDGLPFPLEHVGNTMFIKFAPPNPRPPLGKIYTVIFTRRLNAPDHEPYTFVAAIEGQHA